MRRLNKNNLTAHVSADFLVSIVLHRCKVMMAISNEKSLKNETPTTKMILYPADAEENSHNVMQINKDPGKLLTRCVYFCVHLFNSIKI